MTTRRRPGGAPTTTRAATTGADLLARTGRGLLAATDPDAVYGLLRRALADLCAGGGLGVLVLARDGDHARVTLAAGLPRHLSGTRVDATALPACPPDGTPVPVRRRELAAVPALAAALRGRWLLGAALHGGTGPAAVLLAAGTRPLAGTTRAVLDALLAQYRLARYRLAPPGQAAGPDPLTGIGTRAALRRHLDAALAAGTGGHTGLLLLDVDNVTGVNDAFGDDAGDAVLVEVARRLAGHAGTAGLAARTGGDEFALLLPAVAGPEAVLAAAVRLRDDLARPVTWAGTPIPVTVSVGVAAGTTGTGTGTAELMRSADVALCAAKALGPGRVVPFRADRHGGAARLRGLAAHLSDAITRDEIVLHYQPLIDLGSGRCVGVEALVRWQHPVLGTLAPSAFLPLARREGHLVELGRYVLAAACRQVMMWRPPRGLPELRLAVNISPEQLAAGVEAPVAEALRASGLPPQRLTLELAEPGLLGDRDLLAALPRLRDLGIRLALDDAGADGATLHRLHAVGVHQVKVDRRLLGTDPGTADTLVRAIMAACRRDGLETVAEAIETDGHAEWARGHGFTLAQGFLYSRALPAPQAAQWLSGTGWRARRPGPVQARAAGPATHA